MANQDNPNGKKSRTERETPDGRKPADSNSVEDADPETDADPDSAEEGTQETEEEEEESDAGETDNEESLIRRMRLTDWVMAIATAVIAGATVWNVFYVRQQIMEMRRSTEGVERPYLAILVKSFDILSGDFTPERSVLSAPDYSPAKGVATMPKIALSVENGGRQPAIIDKFKVNVFMDAVSGGVVTPENLLGDEGGPLLSSTTGLIALNFMARCMGADNLQYLPVGGSVSITCDIINFQRSTEPQAVITNRESIYLVGAADYRGPLGVTWQAGITMKYEPPVLGNPADHGRFTLVTDPKFTYEKQLN